MKKLRNFFLNDTVRAFALVLLIALFALGISSCSCDYHARQISKRCGGSVTDTVTYHDSIFIDKIEKDTVFKINSIRDTLVLKQDRLTIKYFYNTHDSTIYLQGKCDSIIIYRDIKIPVEKVVVKRDDKWLIILFITIALAAIYLYRRRT